MAPPQHLERAAGRAKSPEEKAKDEIERGALNKIMEAIDEGKAGRAAGLNAEEVAAVAPLQLLTMKPLTYAANVAEDELGSPEGNVHVKVRARLCCTWITASSTIRCSRTLLLLHVDNTVIHMPTCY